ncbi:MAG: hypothetical protein CO093_02135 [Alphaproteobacteria bacterium CG_4_9_14_3_um_filter_47_13]|nr:MAG: hypothetical protein CO093_02135 [Alphaproteobacteria bacterium CG_4_9_14_3_um_filter_47_13]
MTFVMLINKAVYLACAESLASENPPSPVQPKTEAQKTFTQAQERPVKTTTNSQVRAKIRAEAETKRAQVPPEYRAEPYEPRQETPKQTTETQRTEASGTFNQGATTSHQPEQTTRPRMSSHFNMKSGAHDNSEDQPCQAPSDKPEAEI